MGRRSKGTLYASITYVPANMPAEPIPATNRPMIRTRLLGAAPHIKLPSSKMVIVVMNTFFILKNVYSFPQSN
jgi:hypothetical protein